MLPKTWKEFFSSPTYFFGTIGVIGTAGVPVCLSYGAPKWLTIASGLMAGIGFGMAHFGAADAKDLPPPPPQ